MTLLRSACLVILFWACANAHGSAEADFSHWRWWFLASTTDSATIEIYNRVEHAYLHVSDLRVLREDLAHVYIKLADSIVSESDAQTAALLIRLFHYSAARPFKTAELVNRLSVNLTNYLSTPAAAKLEYEVGVDLWVASDLGARCVISADTYRNQQSMIDNNRMAGIIDARVRVGSADNLNRNRFMVQSVDGVTKFLDFNGVVDSTLATDLISALGQHFDTLDLLRQPDLSLPGPWHLLLRFHLAMKARLYSNHNECWKSQDATNAFAIESNGKQSSAPMCLPEARLRASIIGHQLARAASTNYMGWALESSKPSVIAFIMTLECLFPSGSGLLDQTLLQALAESQPVSAGILGQSEVRKKVSDSLVKATRLYSDCFRLIYRGKIAPSSTTQVPACSIDVALEDLMYDENYQLRRLQLLQSAGQRDVARYELAQFVRSVSRNGYQHRAHSMLLEWSDGSDLTANLDSVDKQFYFSVATADNWKRLQNLVKTANPWSTSYLQNLCKARLVGALRAADTVFPNEQRLLHSVWSNMLQLRGAATNEARSINGVG